MHILTALFTFAVLATAVLANKCNHDNCYRALAHYQANDTCFCNEYLATATKQAPSRIATCGDKKISSACSCLTTTTPPPTTTTTPTTTLTTSTSTTSTCARSSASACPTSATKCCAYLCAEAQVPFDLCSETDTSGQFQKCSKCPVS